MVLPFGYPHLPGSCCSPAAELKSISGNFLVFKGILLYYGESSNHKDFFVEKIFMVLPFGYPHLPGSCCSPAAELKSISGNFLVFKGILLYYGESSNHKDFFVEKIFMVLPFGYPHLPGSCCSPAAELKSISGNFLVPIYEKSSLKM